MKTILITTLILVSGILFAEEVKPEHISPPVKDIIVGETVHFEFEEDSIKDGYRWVLDTLGEKSIKADFNSPIQRKVDTFNITFTKPGRYRIDFSYTKNKKNITKIIHQSVHVLEDVKLKWCSNYSTAIEKAKKENKIVMLFFTGSNWCGACKSLDKWVFHTKEFEEYANKNLILFKVDFPKDLKEGKLIRSEIAIDMKRLYSFENKFPTCIFVTPDEKEIGKIVGDKEERWMPEMKEIVEKKKK